jgi:type II secretory pathway pseudopilin PulG
MKWKRWAVIIGAVLLTGLVAYCVARSPNYSALKAQGNMLVQQIDAYRAAHGEYPRSLEDAHIENPLTFFGYWHYERTAGNSFWLSVGDYGRDGFTLRYIPDRGWNLDT